ncbi:hypothetical protein [Demequina gelatinilytica]|uniref:hypothetical protein n=1 Tax=Demequina gelatinilytica TaxID=1638980 RepID=UPI0007828F28|nr:hypothetical protein [Demequina gelatinilytica]
MGEPLMPWQRWVLDVALEIDPSTGHFFYREVRIALPRQQGKTTAVKTRALFQALAWAKQRIVYTAQSRNMARQRLEEDFYDPISASVLAATLARTSGDKPGFRAQAGSEHISFINRSGWWIDAVTKKSGHGPSLDLGLIDEAFAHVDSRIEQAMRPAMMQRPNAQLWVLSTAGDGDSLYWRQKVDDLRDRIASGAESRVAGFEWSADDDADPDDPEVWRSVMPAYGVILRDAIYGPRGEVIEPELVAAGEDLVRAERDSMDEDDFRRAFLNQWVDKKATQGIIAFEPWKACTVPDNDPDVWTGDPLWAIDVSPYRDSVSIAMAGAPALADRRTFAEVVTRLEDTRNAVGTLVKLRTDHGGNIVAVDGTGAAGSLIPDLEEAGFEVIQFGQRDKVAACGSFYDAVYEGSFSHMNDPLLNDAVLSARKRDIGDGAWVFTRRGLNDITPLYAVLLARWAWIKERTDDYDIADSLG